MRRIFAGMLAVLLLAGCGKRGNTYEFHGRSYDEEDLPSGVIQWLEHYNSLSPEEQEKISFCPPELADPTEEPVPPSETADPPSAPDPSDPSAPSGPMH